MSIASMSARINSFCGGLARVFGKKVRKVFAFRFMVAYEMFDTLKKCFVKVCQNASGVASTGQVCRNLIVPYNKWYQNVLQECHQRVCQESAVKECRASEPKACESVCCIWARGCFLFQENCSQQTKNDLSRTTYRNLSSLRGPPKPLPKCPPHWINLFRGGAGPFPLIYQFCPVAKSIRNPTPYRQTRTPALLFQSSLS